MSHKGGLGERRNTKNYRLKCRGSDGGGNAGTASVGEKLRNQR